MILISLLSVISSLLQNTVGFVLLVLIFGVMVCPFSVCHCIVCLSIYVGRLRLWYLKHLFLLPVDLRTCNNRSDVYLGKYICIVMGWGVEKARLY